MTSLPLKLSAADYPYATKRMPVLAPRGVVATRAPLGAQAGLSMLQAGGNAVDAALATAIALTVIEPTSNGIGADAFALVWDGSTLHGFNGSGRAPKAHTLDLFKHKGHASVPAKGWMAVTVPGAPAAWRDLHARFGRLPFEKLFEPAIWYAEHGFPVGPVTGAAWSGVQRSYEQTYTTPEYRGWLETFAPGGKAPGPGDVWSSKDHARTLRLIAESKADAFYRGELAKKIAGFAAETGGYLTVEDLAAHTSTLVDPIGTSYRGYEVWEIPPNGQGIVALTALNILEGFDVSKHARESVESYHLQIESTKLAFADAFAYVADMEHADVPVKGLLDKEYAAQRRSLISDKALDPKPGDPPRGGTVYLCAADADGMMISLIQSNYQGFGSGVVVPGTGIALQNRGAGFVLDPAHPNVIAPGKRPFHTIIPAFLTEGGKAVGPFGVMGGHMQPQGHLQVVVNQVDYGLNPQASLDAPRFHWVQGRKINLEVSGEHMAGPLRERGHDVEITRTSGSFGKGQIIRRLPNGSYIAGSEPRCDGAAVGY
jgi:gamma-glutamyltranspeptidase / glutathione hydrolase